MKAIAYLTWLLELPGGLCERRLSKSSWKRTHGSWRSVEGKVDLREWIPWTCSPRNPRKEIWSLFELDRHFHPLDYPFEWGVWLTGSFSRVEQSPQTHRRRSQRLQMSVQSHYWTCPSSPGRPVPEESCHEMSEFFSQETKGNSGKKKVQMNAEI